MSRRTRRKVPHSGRTRPRGFDSGVCEGAGRVRAGAAVVRKGLNVSYVGGVRTLVTAARQTDMLMLGRM